MRLTRDRLYQGLYDQFNQNDQQLMIRNSPKESLPNTLNISFDGINAKQLVNQLSDQLAFSTGSACHEDTKHPTMSTTLQAIGKIWIFSLLNQFSSKVFNGNWLVVPFD